MLSLESFITSGARRPARRLVVGMVLSIGAVACAEAGEESAAPVESRLAQQVAAGQVTNLRDPQGLYSAKVTTGGTGCPAGTATTTLAKDGLQFTTQFTQFFATVNRTIETDVRDCTMSIQLSGSQRRSYAIANFAYSGYASLEQGVIGRQTASYNFQGTPVRPAESTLVGPRADPYLFSDDVPERDRSWSPCGLVSDLNVMTRIQLTNSTPRRNGFMGLSLLDGSTKVSFKLQTRLCDTPGAVGGGPVTSGPSQSSPPAGASSSPPTSGNQSPPPFVPGRTPSTPSQSTSAASSPSQNGPLASSPPAGQPTSGSKSPPPFAPGKSLPASSSPSSPVASSPPTGGNRSSGNPVQNSPTGPAPSPPSGGLGEATVTVQPSVVLQNQRIRVSWTPGVGHDASTRYRLRFTRFGDPSGQLVWESLETSSTFFDVDSGRLPVGDYEVVVASRNGTRATYSVPALVRVFAAAPR